MCTTCVCVPQAHCSALATLVRIDAATVLPLLMDRVSDTLSQSALAAVTTQEYEIMLTPEGQLYDKSVIERSVAGCVPTRTLQASMGTVLCMFYMYLCVYFVSRFFSV